MIENNNMIVNSDLINENFMIAIFENLVYNRSVAFNEDSFDHTDRYLGMCRMDGRG